MSTGEIRGVQDLRRAGTGTVVAWRADPETFRFTYVSEEALDLLGYLPQRWLNEAEFWQTHIHPEDQEAAVSFCVNSSSRLVPYEFEYRMIAADGRVVWVWDAVHVIVEGGRIKELIGVMVDITERKEKERELLRSAEAYRSVVDHAPDYILTLAVDGTILTVNQTMPGVRKEEVIGASLYEFLAPECGARMKGYLESVFRTGEPVGCEVSRAPHRKPHAWFWTRLAALKHDGRVVAVVMVARDITLRREAEQALRESEGGLRSFLDAVPDMMFRIRRDGTLLAYKPGRGEPPALPPADFLNRKLRDLFGEPFASQVAVVMERALACGKSQTLDYRLPVPYPGGELQSFQAELTPAGDEEVVARVRRVDPPEDKPAPAVGVTELAENAGKDLLILVADAKSRCESLLRMPHLDGATRSELEGILRGLGRSAALMRQFMTIRRV